MIVVIRNRVRLY